MDIREDNAGKELADRNPLALEYIMNIYGSSVYGLVCRILDGIGKREDIEECVNDAFVAVWNKIDAYDDKRGTLKTFVLIQAKYIALDCRRMLARRPGTDELSNHVSDQKALEDTVLSKEASKQLVRLIDSFSEPDRSIFFKRYFYYEPLEVIAREMGLTVRAVESRLARTRKALRQQFGHWTWEEDDRHAQC